MTRRIKIVIAAICSISLIVILALYGRPTIESITLSSPNNRATAESITVTTNKPTQLYVEFWRDGESEILRTPLTDKSSSHNIALPLLSAGSKYNYTIKLDGLIPSSSKTFSFQTREESPWLVKNWIKSSNRDSSLLGDGLIMICSSRVPGSISMIDTQGEVRWHWQVKDIGVRVANLTPRGTILAMLRPPKDINEETPPNHSDILKQGRPTRKGVLGFLGGTALAEISLEGELLWRVDLDKKYGDKYEIIHHDIQMDRDGFIHTIYRDVKGDLGGDGIMVLDTLGNIVKRWSIWDHWDIENDPMLATYPGDRFHANGLAIDTDGNYLLSLSIEDQIWKIDAKSGEVIWKLGNNGDFQMEESDIFAFQHAPHINRDGDIMLFDNGLDKKQSRTLSFKLDLDKMVAEKVIDAPLPLDKYSSRMGSGYLLPNGNLLQTSSKRGAIVITDIKGEILWELNNNIIPYRAEFIPNSIWNSYFYSL